ncbi:MAG: endolytic transglycosylase MltG [Acidimicrobiales bacterium]
MSGPPDHGAPDDDHGAPDEPGRTPQGSAERRRPPVRAEGRRTSRATTSRQRPAHRKAGGNGRGTTDGRGDELVDPAQPAPSSSRPVVTQPGGAARGRGGDGRAGTGGAGSEWEPTATPPTGVPVVRRARPAAERGAGRGGPIDREPEEREHARRGDATGSLTHLGPVSPYRMRSRHRFPRRVRLLLTVAVIVVLVLVGGFAWYETTANPGKPGKQVLLHVAKGESMGAITATLADDGVVSSGIAFRVSNFFHGAPTVRPGGYVLRKNQSFGKVRAELAAGPNVFLVSVPAGFTLAEIAKVLATAPDNLAKSFQTEAQAGAVSSPFQSAPGTSLEGLLGPGTYELMPGETAKQLLTQMVQRFQKEAAAAGLTPTSAAALGYTPYQVVTVASITQKEGYYKKYMGPVARVIYNRLAAGMPLGMTSTVLYALGQDGGKITSADHTLASPYNTYINPGLTPTPICFPSPTALEAAASPPPGNWLYFDLVTPKKGVMVFSSTYTQQLKAEQQAQANAAAQGG